LYNTPIYYFIFRFARSLKLNNNTKPNIIGQSKIADKQIRPVIEDKLS